VFARFLTPKVLSITLQSCRLQEQVLSQRNLFLVKLLGGNSSSPPRTHPKELASAQTPHVISSILRGPARQRKAALLKLSLLDLERHDGIVALLDYGPLDHEFRGRQERSTIGVFPVSDAE